MSSLDGRWLMKNSVNLKETEGKVTGGKELGEEIIYFQVRNCSDITEMQGKPNCS